MLFIGVCNCKCMHTCVCWGRIHTAVCTQSLEDCERAWNPAELARIGIWELSGFLGEFWGSNMPDFMFLQQELLTIVLPFQPFPIPTLC